MLLLLLDHVQWESSNSWLKTNLAEGRFLSDQQVGLTPPWLHYMGRAGTGEVAAAHNQRGKGVHPTVSGSSLSSAWAIPAVHAQYEFRQFQVLQTTENW